MKKHSAYEIALSSLSCAFATIAITLGTLYSPLLFSGYLFAGFALMIPLTKDFWMGSILAYLATACLSLMFNGFNFWDTLPFIAFFGLHPLVNWVQLKLKIKRWIATLVKAAWFDGAMYLVWRFVYKMVTSVPFVDKYIIPIILIGGTAFFIVYDFMFFKCQIAVNNIVSRIIKK